MAVLCGFAACCLFSGVVFLHKAKQGSFNSQTSPASKNRAPIHHESAKSLRPGQYLISSLVMGIAMCFWSENVLKVLGSGQSDVRSGTWPR